MHQEKPSPKAHNRSMNSAIPQIGSKSNKTSRSIHENTKAKPKEPINVSLKSSKLVKGLSSKSPKKIAAINESKQLTPLNSKENPKREGKTIQPKVDMYEYEDDFENYSDDFESDEETDVPQKDQPEHLNLNPLQFHEPSISTTNINDEKLKDKEYGTAPELIQSATLNDMSSVSQELRSSDDYDTPVIRRLASRQSGRQAEIPKQEKIERKTTWVAPAERKINFSSVSMINYGEASESEKRYRKLHELITLETSTLVVLDQPPVKDYDFYMGLFGDSGKNQVSTQTGEDDINEEIQTEEQLNDTKWTQYPAQDDFGWGAENITVENDSDIDKDKELFKNNHLQNSKLKKFVEIAGQVIINLVSSRNRKVDHIEMKNKSQFAFSAGFNKFELGPVAQGSRVTSMSRNPQDPELLLVNFFVTDSPAEELIKRSLFVEFFLEEQQPPKRIYLSEGEVLTTSYSPDGTALFSGLKDGSVVAFDLLEPVSSFENSLPWMDSPSNLPIRTPAYDSSYLSSAFSNGRTYPVIDVQVLAKQNVSYQVAALDESGSLSLWNVLRDEFKGPGIRPGARLTLQLIAFIRPDPSVVRSSSQPTSLIANCMLVNVDPQMFLIGTDIGFLCTLARTKSVHYTGPRFYNSKLHVYGEVTCIRPSPFEDSIILVGLSSGYISIYHIKQSSPLVDLTPPKNARGAVTSIEWSQMSPSVFYSIHQGNKLLVWDLVTGRTPQMICNLKEQISSPVTSTTVWISKSMQSSGMGIAYLALGVQAGYVEVHALETPRSRIQGSLLSLLKNIGSKTL